MPIPFNADEVFEMAEQIERNGAKFYRAAAKKFPDVSKVLLDLAAMEDKHLKTFQAMRAELPSSETEPLVFDPDNQAHLYLQVMADGHVFEVKSDPTEKLSSHKKVQDVLKTAIGIEKDSIAFYVGLKECVSRTAGKEKIEAIIRQELGHIAILNQKMADLQRH
jgi:rubrerythrin